MNLIDEGRPAGPAHHVQSLDGLRALAILAVMVYHARLPGWRVGWLGVDLFFALSGFLITHLLVREHQRAGRVSLLRFWGRRFLRLMPIYWLFVACITFFVLRGAGGWNGDEHWTRWRYVASLWGYFANYAPLDLWQPYQEISGPLWSLSVEEQFYFIWPLLCALALRTRRPWVLGWTMLAAVAVCRVFVTDELVVQTRIYTRGIGIVTGCAVALALGRGMPDSLGRLMRSQAARWVAVALCILFFAAAEWLAHAREDLTDTWRPLTWGAAIVFPPLVAMLWYGPRDRIARFLSLAPLAYVGRISYGMYLYHSSVKFLVWDAWPQGFAAHRGALAVGLRIIAYFGLTLAIASASYFAIERPFLKLKERLR
jgi:peptidoglycan/LPS O-acetylase OafA/YrhL